MDSYRHSTFVQNGEILLGKKTNVLLVKDDVGRAKPSTRTLPKDEFAFGRPDPTSEGAANGKLC